MRQYLHILSICNISDVHFHLIVFLEVATPDLEHNSKLENLVVRKNMGQTQLTMQTKRAPSLC